MKKLSFTLLVFVSIGAKAQWVSIPDTNFGNWLNTYGYVTCMQGNSQVGWQMDTTCSAVVNEDSVYCGGREIHDLTGIEYFDNLILLECRNNPINNLPVLPSTLIQLNCHSNGLNSLPSLPNGLTTLACSGNYLTSLPQLPANLTQLYCWGNQLTALPPLPNGLAYLNCSLNQLTYLPALPDYMVILNCSDNPDLLCFPRINTIRMLNINGTGITCMANYSQMPFDTSIYYITTLCDSANTNGCHYCHPSFNIFPDSVNPGVYFGFNQSYSSSPVSYLWQFGDGDTSTQQFPSHTYATPGQYNICLTVSNADCINTFCDSSYLVFKMEGGLMSQLNILNPATAVSEIRNPNSAIRISPNPASTHVIITIDESLLNSTATITDITGRKIAAVQLTTTNLQLETSRFESGVYFITITNSEGKTATKKLVVSK